MLVLISTIHVIFCLFLILVVLLQQGKGADLSVFGGGGTQAAFGARGATTLLHKLTVIGFVGFIVTTMLIGLLKTTQRTDSVITDVPAAAAPAVPEPAATDGPAAMDEAATAMAESAGTPSGEAEAMPPAAAEDSGPPAEAGAADEGDAGGNANEQ